jgi:SAM-dependent methyltransferase
MSYHSDILFRITNRRKETDVVWNRYFRDVKGKILDAGCSIGNFISLDPTRIIGIDVDKDALAICRKRGFEVLYMDLNKKLKFPDNYFSAIHCSHVIEHLDNPLFTMKEFHRVLKPSGKLVLFTPNVLRYKFKIFDEYTHKHFFTPKSLEELTYDAGFRDFEIREEHRSIRGLGWLMRRGIKVDIIIKIQNFLAFLNITNPDLVLVATKTK